MTDRADFEAWYSTPAGASGTMEDAMRACWQAAIKHEREMPASYTASTTISSPTKGANVNFYFSDAAEADAWHEKIVRAAAALGERE